MGLSLLREGGIQRVASKWVSASSFLNFTFLISNSHSRRRQHIHAAVPDAPFVAAGVAEAALAAQNPYWQAGLGLLDETGHPLLSKSALSPVLHSLR